MGKLISAIFFSLIVGGGAAVVILGAMGRRSPRGPNWRTAAMAGLAVFLAIFVVMGLFDSFTQVQYGSVAVVTQFGQVKGAFKPGLSWKIPFIQSVIVYRTQEIIYETVDPAQTTASQADYTDVDVDTATSDGQQIRARFTVRFFIEPDRATDIANNLGPEDRMVEKVIKATSRVHVRNILKRYSASQLYSGNVEEAQAEIELRLKEEFQRAGLELTFFGLRSILFSDAYKEAVEKKQIEAENIKTKENLAKQAEFEKQRTITEAQGEAERQRLERTGIAQGEAESIRVKAIAEADATRLKAEAQAEANRKIAASLTPEMIQWQAVQTWSGIYPLVLGSTGQYILPGDLFTQSLQSR
jgi:regulator of protease activity HflC (stomatin/prohibitin superfamily)